jgi:hypothetical protein
MNNCKIVHFIGFKDDRYWNAVKIYGKPHVIHRGWDLRAKREIDENDLLVFANGDWEQPPRQKSFSDFTE